MISADDMLNHIEAFHGLKICEKISSETQESHLDVDQSPGPDIAASDGLQTCENILHEQNPVLNMYLAVINNIHGERTETDQRNPPQSLLPT